MFVRTTTRRRGDKTYSYVQLVESFRRPTDKLPTQRVIANLGDLSPAVVENLKLALKASRDGRTLVLAPETAGGVMASDHCVTANLKYLDVAVMREMWQHWNLPSLLGQLCGEEQCVASTAQIVEALTLQRAVGEPGSKSYAERWFPGTALPELMGLPPAKFNNTRVHRALQRLHEIGGSLAERLPSLYQSKEGAFGCCFMDVTRTHFEGSCYDSAETSKTRVDSDIKKRIGIVLLSNNQGYPLRWKTIGGRTMDVTGMGDMARSLAGVEWLRNVPIIFDRAMGSEKTVRSLLATDLRFLTAARANSIDSYLGYLPKYSPTFLVTSAAGLFPLLSVALCMSEHTAQVLSESTMASKLALPVYDISQVTIVGTDDSFEDDVRSIGEAAKRAGLVEVDPCLFTKDIGVVRLSDTTAEDYSSGPLCLRLLAYFNPQLFVEQQRRSKAHLEAFYRFVDGLNKELSAAKKSRNEAATMAKVRKYLETRNWLGLFEVKLTSLELTSEAGRTIQSFQCQVQLNRAAWSRHRRYHGFVLLLAHPSLVGTSSQLALSYRAKDVIEKDFQTIKSTVKLRPVFHYTDPKVQAHVTLCMLALLLQRTLEAKLREGGVCLSAPAALEALSGCHLNRMGTGAMYSVTAPTALQREILKVLGLSRLVKPSSVSQAITPRSA